MAKCFSNKIKLIGLVMLWHVNTNYAQQDYNPVVESFESEKALDFYNTVNSKLSISNAHRRFGKSSLQWEWSGESSIGTSHFKTLTLSESPLSYGDYFPASPTLQMSIYNEMPQKGKITISYEKEGNKEVWFDIQLSFTGWRRIWVPFYEMQGNAPQKEAQIDYDYFKITASTNSGKLFFDDIIFSQFQDDRHQYPDLVVPFIKKNQAPGVDHWMPSIVNYKRIQELQTRPVSGAIKADLKKFESLIDADLVIDKKYKAYINSLKESFQKLNLHDNGKTILGPPLTFKHKQDYFDKNQQGKEEFNDVKDLGSTLKKLAVYYDRVSGSEKQSLEKMFITGIKYFLDQGWQAGSSGGTRHHIGYNVREITEACYIMRRLLKEENLLSDVGNSLHWLFNLGMILDNEKNFHVNIDYLNTQSYYHLMLIFLVDNLEKQAMLLSAYSKYMSIILAQQKEEWGFKVDGTSWHHNGHYPAYGMGAFRSVPRIIRTLSGTRFRIRPQGHENFKRAFLTTRAYSQLYDFGFGNAGRHPLENNDIKSLKKQYLLMAYSGNPIGTEKIDKDVAAAYLRLWGEDDMMNTSIFTELNGINKEKLKGYYTLPYAATAIHRGKTDWAAIIKGYSKYVWASEIYVASNRYGRYPANGTVQLLNVNGEKGSGFRQEGWDWNRYPGATIIYLPLKELEATKPLLMFRSNETFAGAVELNGNGVFGMVLNEGKGTNADGPNIKGGFSGNLNAKKSVFSFGEKLICIGTNISSVDTINPTQTNLFQVFIDNTKTPIYTSGETIKKFPYEIELKQTSKATNWLIDPYGNGYHILSNTAVKIKKEEQKSYHNKYSINTGKIHNKEKGVKETIGNYASAWVNHGRAPKNASYQYVIYPFQNENEIKTFGNKIKTDKSFKIIRADSVAHIVKDIKTSTVGYVVFQAKKSLESGILKQASLPVLVMAQQKENSNVTLSIVQPDLNFPEYQKGKFRNYSQSVKFSITIAGKWSTAITKKVLSIDNLEDETIITLELKDGLPHEIELLKI